MLLNEQETRDLEERVLLKLRFRPAAGYRGHSLLWWKRPFRLPKPWAVYALDDMSQDQIEQMAPAVKKALLQTTAPGERLYAMDWYHSAFLYDPRKENEQKSVIVLVPWFEYDGNDKAFYEELDRKHMSLKNLLTTYFATRTKEELLSLGEDKIKSELKAQVNDTLVLGKISAVYFNDYIFFD